MATIPTALAAPSVGDPTDTTWADNVALWQAFLSAAPHAQVYQSAGAAQSVHTATWTTVLFDQKVEDNDSLYSAGATDRLTIKTAGLYELVGGAGWVVNATGARGLRFLKNGTALMRGHVEQLSAGAATLSVMTSTLRLRLAVNDDIRMQVMQSSGADLTLCNTVDSQPSLDVLLCGL